MERGEKVEVIQKTVEKLIEQEQFQSERSHLFDSFVAVNHHTTATAKHEDDDGGVREADHRQQLLSQLLTQLESLKEETPPDQMNQSTNLQETPSVEKVEKLEDEEEKVVKELKKIQKQNFITHCLLSGMIVVTLAWQLSEVSLILKMKDGFNHPLRSIGSLLTGWIKGPPPVLNGKEVDLNDSAKQLKHRVETLSIPSLKMPELPHMEMPSLDFINEED